MPRAFERHLHLRRARQIAVDAHARAGMVRAIGMLRRERRSWMLDSVSLFEAVLVEDA